MNNKTKEKEQKWIPVKSGKLPKNNASCWITAVVDGKRLWLYLQHIMMVHGLLVMGSGLLG